MPNILAKLNSFKAMRVKYGSYAVIASGGPFTIDYLVVAGGGAGGQLYYGGGGGAGTYTAGTATPLSGAYTVTIGAGGAAPATVNSGQSNARSNSGSNSVFDIVTSAGGSGGRTYTSVTLFGQGGAVAVGGESGRSHLAPYKGSGGGGAGITNAGSTTTNENGGAGGAGTTWLNGTYYAGGGGGGAYYIFTGGAGGAGGGGEGASGSSDIAGVSGTVNTGGGGGGAEGNFTLNVNAGAGGSGVVIIRYLGAQVATGGTITSLYGYTIHTFTGSGTFTV